jgi:hypothetical protein
LTWAQEQAERKILGILLAHPSLWQRVQVQMDSADFACADLRPLAEIYWDHQRHEGEVVLTELLGMLSETRVADPRVNEPRNDDVTAAPGPSGPAEPANLTQLAMDLVAEVEELAEVDATLTHCLAYLAKQRNKVEQDKQVAQLGRMSQEKQVSGSEDPPAPAAQAAKAVAEEAELAAFAKFVKNLQPTDLHRLGPVRGSGT